MKKVICVLGIIGVMIGFALLVSANIEIDTNSHYTWRRPYTEYEMQVLAIKNIGIALLVSGAIDVILCGISSWYTSKTIQSTSAAQSSFVVCQGCQCKLSKELMYCPNCGRQLK